MKRGIVMFLVLFIAARLGAQAPATGSGNEIKEMPFHEEPGNPNKAPTTAPAIPGFLRDANKEQNTGSMGLNGTILAPDGPPVAPAKAIEAKNPTVADRAKDGADTLKALLSLTADQYNKVQPIITDYLVKAEKPQPGEGGMDSTKNKDVKKAALKEAGDKFKAILTDEQWGKLQASGLLN